MSTTAALIVRPRHGEEISLQELERRLILHCLERQWDWRTFSVLDHPNPFLAAVDAVSRSPMVVVAMGWGSLACSPEDLWRSVQVLADYRSPLVLLEDGVDTERGSDRRICEMVRGVLVSHQGYMDAVTGSPMWDLGGDPEHERWVGEARASLVSSGGGDLIISRPPGRPPRRRGPPRTLPCVSCGLSVHVKRTPDGLACPVCGEILQEISSEEDKALEAWAEGFGLGEVDG